MDSPFSLRRLLEPEIMDDPYGFYHQLHESDPVHWDALLHAWAVKRYPDVVTVLHRSPADHTLTAEQLTGMALEALMVGELLRFESPAQLPHEHATLGSTLIRCGPSVIAVIAAGNRRTAREH
jgi:cytochrome P450